jgi:hypothetical protein
MGVSACRRVRALDDGTSNPLEQSPRRNLCNLRIIKVCAHRPLSAAEVCFTIPNLRFGFVFSPSM